ncbi:MAG: A/G-specific adenine glycosylase [Bacteroidota bacterium]|jgi:A/G-specific adenine glycosylase
MFPKEELLGWYDRNKRAMPWRESVDPYCIWLSEIILQQTRVDQGMPYYERFVTTFPNVKSLANASEDEVLKLWEGLGYYSRARNLHATAKYIASDLEGNFPTTYQGLLALKGVGPYTAAAIGSIAFGLKAAAVDGNVNRVLARFFGIMESIDEASTKKTISILANEVLNSNRPGDHNQAIMELGATVCTPQQPDCVHCPLVLGCKAQQLGSQSELPVRSKRVRIRNRYFNYTAVLHDDEVAISRRGQGDIWQGLYEFPLIETDSRLSETDLVQMVTSEYQGVVISISKEFKHVLSHQHVYARFLLLRVAKRPTEDLKWVSMAELRKFAFPRLINRYIDSSSFDFDAEVSNI